MAKNDLWQLLNADVSVANVKALLTGQTPPSAVVDPAEAQAAEILAYATREAKSRGKRVEEVLAELGFAVPVNSTPAAAPAAPPQSAPPAAASSPPPPPPPAPPAPPLDPAAVALARLLVLLPHLSGPELQPFLDKLSAASLDRLCLLYPDHDALARSVPADAQPLWLALVAKGLPLEALANALRTEPGFPVLNQEEFQALPRASGLTRGASKAAINDIPAEWVRALRLAPLRRNGAATVIVISYPPPERLVQQLARRSGRRIQVHVASAQEVDEIRAQLPGGLPATSPSASLPSPVSPPPPAPAPPAPAAAVVLTMPPQVRVVIPPAPAAPVVHERPLMPELRYTSAVAAFEQILRFALDSRATDIHIEPAERAARVRFRIDGICHEATRLPPDAYLEIVARIKVLADLDVTERRRPQDGHIHIAVNGTEHDLRVSSVPARGGEKVGLRIANTGRVSMRLDQLGLLPSDLALLRDISTLPFGMILATGPVGSGKTTTLYSCLNEVDRDHRHVMSIEDPVEFTLEGANHVEVNYSIGFDFVQGLRALLRQDPDTILIGEIRDEETARIAVRASMTGLMVYSTLHANEATGAVTTLRNYHIAPHLLASAIRGVIAQRLLRKICESCKVPHSLTAADAHLLGFERLPDDLVAFRGVGCPACLHTGYKGRTGVFEIFHVDEVARNMILEEVGEREIRAHAVARGMRTLQQDGLRKISEGVTTIEEYHRVLRF